SAPAPSAPRFEAPRGAPRAALALPAGDPAPHTVQAAPSPGILTVGTCEALIALAAQKRDIGIKLALERDVRLVRCEDGRLEITLEATAAQTLVNGPDRHIT